LLPSGVLGDQRLKNEDSLQVSLASALSLVEVLLAEPHRFGMWEEFRALCNMPIALNPAVCSRALGC
jgi:hypothetical protein